MSSLFDLQQVVVTYPPNTQALKEVNLLIGPGEFTVLLGPSGSGKSTFLRTLNGLVTPTTGQVNIHNKGSLNNNRELKEHRRQTGMIFQSHQLIPRRSALKNVLMGRIGYHSTWRTLFPYSKEEVNLALECLQRVGLLHKANTRCDELSGGEKQRVGIARALCQQPKIILADEPVASLDPASSIRVLSLLKDICTQDNLTAVVSLHQVDYAKQFAKRIIGLNEGRIVFDGPPQKLSDNVIQIIYKQNETMIQNKGAHHE